jgi:hypothetical protein
MGASKVGAMEQAVDVELEISKALWRNHRLLPPTNKTHNRCRDLLYWLMVYNCFYAPMQVAFEIDYPIWQLALDYVIDILFVVEILAMFRTTFYNDLQELVLDKEVIKQDYLRSRFTFDALAAFPWEIFGLAASGGYNTTTFKGLRLFRFLRIMRVWKLHAVPGEKKMNQAQRVRATLLWFLFMTHWIACIWWGIGVVEYRDAVSDDSDEFATRTWLQRPNYKSVLLDDNTRQNFWLNYWSSYYWGITIMMKTNWIPPKTAGELAFSAVVCLLGAITFAVILGQVNLLIRKFDETSALRREKMGLFRAFADLHKCPARLAKKMVAYADAEWTCTGGVSTMSALKPLPRKMSTEMVLVMYKDVVPLSPLFNKLSKPCVAQLLLNSTTQACMKKENLICFKETAREVFILLKGTLEITLPANVRNTVNNARNSMGAARMSRVSSHNKKQQNRRIVEREGSIVGCWNVYDRTLRYPFQVKATVQSTLLNISRSAMLQVCNEYLSDKETLTSALTKEHRLTTDALKLTGKGGVEEAEKEAAAEAARRAAEARGDRPVAISDVRTQMAKMYDDIEDVSKELGRMADDSKVIAHVLGQLGGTDVLRELTEEAKLRAEAKGRGRKAEAQKNEDRERSDRRRQQQDSRERGGRGNMLGDKEGISAETNQDDAVGAMAAMVL